MNEERNQSIKDIELEIKILSSAVKSLRQCQIDLISGTADVNAVNLRRTEVFKIIANLEMSRRGESDDTT